MLLNNSYRPRNTIEGAEDNFDDNEVGIVHFGAGAFHRAHQAVYTHKILKKHGGDWRILGVSLQSTEIADILNAQGGVYSLIQRGAHGSTVSLIKSIKNVEAATRGTELIFKHLASPKTRIVSMTVTEKAYGILREEGRVDLNHESIAHDVANPEQPIGIIGMIVKGLRMRKALGLKPYTVLCCDNLPKNGDLVRKGVLDFTLRIGEPELAAWIESHAAFPNSMVDRITPATTPKLIDEVTEHLGVSDRVPVETEAFSQWVVEDKFSDGRPKWEDVGVIFVEDVAPYEHMKLRMLNGAHSLIAYLGFLSGHKLVRDVMADKQLAPLVDRHIKAAALTLAPIKEIDFKSYANDLIKRFENPHIAHETYQIAMDGSQKMPQRIFEPALDSLKAGSSIEPFALATAVWIFFCSGEQETIGSYKLRDPREAELVNAYKSGASNSDQICDAFFQLPDLFPKGLIQDEIWKTSVSKYLQLMINKGVSAAIADMET